MRQVLTNRPWTNLAAGALASAVLIGGTAQADAAPSALQLSLNYTADVSGVAAGGRARRGRFLDDLRLAAELDLERAAGWRGARAHARLLNSSGGAANAAVGSLEGVDNIEVSRGRGRVYDAWIEQSFAQGQGAVLVGLYDLNSEFYANDSAALLLGPAFGIGSELAATGSNGPSIFPSTALAVRGRWTTGSSGYLQAAVANARAGTIGDSGGVNVGFDEGVLAIAEAGFTGPGKLAAGVWRYSARQDDWRQTTAAGGPVKRTAEGAYLLLERRLAGDAAAPRHTTAFARLGLSDGQTTPFRGGWQAGVLAQGVFAGRPDSTLSVGVSQAWITRRARDNGADAGQVIGPAETAFEATYADSLNAQVTLQPDVQYVIRPGGARDVRNALVTTLRVRVAYGRP